MPITNVNLMGPNPGQPMDIQTQQAQLAQAQKIAEALIAQGLTQESPIIHTGGGNPFARDVANWSGPLGKALQTMAGVRRQRELNEQQLGLANEFNDRTKQGIFDFLRTSSGSSEEMAGPPMEGHEMPPRVTPGDPIAAFANAMGSGLGPVQDIAKALLGANVAIAGKQPSLAEIKSGLIGHGAAPSSVDKAVRYAPGMFGLPIPNVSGSDLVLQTKPVDAKPGNTVYGMNPDPGVGGTQPIVTAPIPQAGPLMPPTGPGEPPMQADKEGIFKVPSGWSDSPAAKSATDEAKDWGDKLTAGRNRAQSFAKSIPAIKDLINLTENVDAGAFAKQINDVRKALIRLGVTEDTAGKVVDLETMVKYAMPEAVAEGRGMSARITQMEFFKFLENYGVDPTADRRSLQNIFKKSLVNGLNDVKSFGDDIEAAKGSAFGKRSENYRVKLPPPEEIFQGIKPGFSFRQDKTTGVWDAADVGQPSTHTQTPKKIIQFRPGGVVGQ